MDAESFRKAFDGVRESVLDEIIAMNLPPTAVNYMRKVLDYNTPGGKLTRGISVVRAYKCLREATQHTVTEEEVKQAEILGWCVELLQAFFLVADDIMDDSVTRRGQPCWYRVDGIGLKAVNDASILYSCIFILLKKNFSNHPSYIPIVELFNEVCFKTQMGQLLDLESLPGGKLVLSHFTPELYHDIVTFKTAFYSFFLPVALGMRLAGITDKASYDVTQSVCIDIGEYFQIQDDYLDCYGDEATIGKVGTDIQDAKCSWLVVTALQKANAEQRKVLEDHYGKKDPASILAVKSLYADLQLSAAFSEYEEESFTRISSKIAPITEVPKSLFEWLLATIYKRQK